MFDHVQVKVSDYKKSKEFYDQLMNVLGYKVVFEIKNSVVGYGTSTHNMFEISKVRKTAPLTSNVHIAFIAKNKLEVETFFQTGIEYGGKSKGKPGLRIYEPGYYAAFLLDPDGNNIEVVCMV
ncbi:VOC family protein [Patescibacteria group bacterium]|nr:VOC family protein [Patescibacteria group bacterium]